MGTKEKPLLEFVRDQLAVWKGRWQEVSDGSEVSKRTIEKIASGEIADPGVTNCQALADWFRAQAAKSARQKVAQG